MLTLHEGKVIDSLIAGNFGEFQSRTLANRYFGDSILIKVRISKPDYLTQTFDLHNVLDSTTIVDIQTLSLEKNIVGLDLAKVLNLKPIYFDLGKATIRPDAKVELNKIVKILNDNPTIKIELGSHTDCRSSAQSNLTLSDKRAKASAEYIKKRISNPSRVTGKGYGETQLVNKCECEGETVVPCTEEEHQENRRTEFKIVEN